MAHIDSTPKTSHTSLNPGLYLVSTPIGNLKDITLRALDVLKRVDIIACEDTRVTKKLLSTYSIKASLLTYHEYNAIKQGPRILSLLGEGKSVALVSDAGTPLIADPGYRLVQNVRDAGYKIFPIPGPSSVLAALVGAGHATDQFYFAGFLPLKEKSRRALLESLKHLPATLIFLEAPHRLFKTARFLKEGLGNRRVTLARELTKLFEEFRDETLETLSQETKAIKGECVLVIEGASQDSETIEDSHIEKLLEQELKSQSLKDSVVSVTETLKIQKKRVYDLALTLKEKK
ncbi:MAG: 16S rRNA (cytidine(1402)-2'-O)-methyltransferase [bacterium]|nr:16S rRNA (cytidine(1402)-2'-O)-methyltransferase [bacterium]